MKFPKFAKAKAATNGATTITLTDAERTAIAQAAARIAQARQSLNDLIAGILAARGRTEPMSITLADDLTTLTFTPVPRPAPEAAPPAT